MKPKLTLKCIDYGKQIFKRLCFSSTSKAKFFLKPRNLLDLVTILPAIINYIPVRYKLLDGWMPELFVIFFLYCLFW